MWSAGEAEANRILDEWVLTKRLTAFRDKRDMLTLPDHSNGEQITTTCGLSPTLMLAVSPLEWPCRRLWGDSEPTVAETKPN